MPPLPSSPPSRTLLALAVWTLAATAYSATKYPDYYPNKPGTRLSYTSGETQVIGQPVVHKGVKVIPVSHQFGSTTYTQDLLEFRADGSVWLRGVNTAGRLSWYTPPIYVYPPAPLTPGLKWSSATANLKTSSSVVGVLALRIAGANYNTLMIRTETNAGGKISTQMTYFVPALGVVRYETADGSKIDLVR